MQPAVLSELCTVCRMTFGIRSASAAECAAAPLTQGKTTSTNTGKTTRAENVEARLSSELITL
jgi:hypothetical protein